MQTFLPYESFSKSAEVLDDKRLNNQINEGLVILRTITGWYEIEGRTGWPNHPCTKMWSAYPDALARYVDTMINEWMSRQPGREASGIKRHKQVKSTMTLSDRYLWWVCDLIKYPHWLGREDLHLSHRRCLLAKDLEWYGKFWDLEPAVRDEKGRWPYVWPD